DSGDDGGRLAVGVGGGDVGDDVCDHAAVGVCQHSGVVSRSGAWDSGDDGGRLAVGVGGGDVGDDV
ncbi:hypothetical protein CANINC_001927, partial [Pichia inconspicua]